MKKVKTNMPEDKKKKCQVVIHGAAAAAATAAAIPIPLADTIPITAAQVAMIISLGKAFEITVNKSVAEAIAGCQIAQNLGRNLAGSIVKAIPVVNAVSIPVNVAVATALTEGLGWMVADDFYKISVGEEPDNIISKTIDIAELFIGGKVMKIKKKTTPKKKKQ